MQERVHFRGHIVDLTVLDDRWEVVRHAPAVAVLVAAGAMVLGVRQLRPAIGRETWELPAGLVEQGEAPETAAHRELAEEVQLAADLELLTCVYSSPGFTDELVYLYRAVNRRKLDGARIQAESLVVEWREADETWEMVKRGELASSAPTVLGLSIVLSETER